MLITYIRSSSYNAWDWCPHRFFLDYCLGLKTASNPAADRGNIVHKALESLARQKLAIQNKQSSFTDDETGRVFDVSTFEAEQAIDFGWEYYTKIRPTPHLWVESDFVDCRKYMYVVRDFNDGQFWPPNRDIVMPEQFFDLEIDEPWARYSYDMPDGSKLEGQLAIKGTVDLVTRINDDTIEYVDWKTGRRMDWSTRTEKTYPDLCKDFQMLLYFYALTRLYPDVKHVIMTIFFTKDGGPYSMCFDERQVKKTLDLLRERFQEIKGTVRPKLNRGWKTCGLCDYSKILQTGTMKTICQHFQDEMLNIGLDRVMTKYTNNDAAIRYQDGGGRTNVDKKKESGE